MSLCKLVDLCYLCLKLKLTCYYFHTFVTVVLYEKSCGVFYLHMCTSEIVEAMTLLVFPSVNWVFIH